jgi:hypothetical protein
VIGPDYDRIAHVLHGELPTTPRAVVQHIAADLAHEFDADPAFEYEVFMRHVMEGFPTAVTY